MLEGQSNSFPAILSCHSPGFLNRNIADSLVQILRWPYNLKFQSRTLPSFTVFNVGQQDMAMRIYVDLASIEQNGD